VKQRDNGPQQQRKAHYGKKLGYNDISTEIGTFIDVTREAFDSYSYAAGALQAQLAWALSELPAHKQQETLRVLAGLAAKYSTK